MPAAPDRVIAAPDGVPTALDGVPGGVPDAAPGISPTASAPVDSLMAKSPRELGEDTVASHGSASPPFAESLAHFGTDWQPLVALQVSACVNRGGRLRPAECARAFGWSLILRGMAEAGRMKPGCPPSAPTPPESFSGTLDVFDAKGGE